MTERETVERFRDFIELEARLKKEWNQHQEDKLKQHVKKQTHRKA